jgi:hypothetical protein
MGPSPLTKQEVLAKYREKALDGHRILVLGFQDALELVEDCRRANLPILGLDFWDRTNGRLYELGGWSVDLSDIALGENGAARSAQAATEAIQEWMPDGRDYVLSVLARTPAHLLARMDHPPPAGACGVSLVIRDRT